MPIPERLTIWPVTKREDFFELLLVKVSSPVDYESARGRLKHKLNSDPLSYMSYTPFKGTRKRIWYELVRGHVPAKISATVVSAMSGSSIHGGPEQSKGTDNDHSKKHVSTKSACVRR